jgi:thioredoxin-related protein
MTENFQEKYSLEYYYMDGCGHCVDFNKSGVWEKISAKKWNNLTVRKHNMKDQQERVKKFKINGFPSIVIVDLSGSEEVVLESFNNERTYDNIVKFISKYTQ